MAMRFRKSFKIAPGVKLNINKKSASISMGVKGARKTFSTTGRSTTTIGIPGTGLYYTDSKHMKPKKDPIQNNTYISSSQPVLNYNNVIYGLLSLFLGTFGIHKFYAKQTASGFKYLLFCWTGIPTFISFFDGIKHLIKSMRDYWYEKQNNSL